MTYAYVAGFFDGEGHVSLIPRFHRCSLQMTQGVQQDGVLFEISAFLQADGIPNQIYTYDREAPSHAVSHLLITRADAVVKCIEQLLPYLIVKRVAAEAALIVARQTEARQTARRVRAEQWAIEYVAGNSTPTIARRHSVTPAAVKWSLKQRGVTIRDRHVARSMFKPTPEFLEARRQNFREALDIRWAARRQELPALLLICRAEYVAGASIKKLTEKYKVHYQTLRPYLKAEGILRERAG